jgi:hypothetical protein
MRLMIALLAGVVISLPAFAAEKKKAAKSKAVAHKRVPSKFEVKFLTYSQLTALPEKKRMAYIRDIAKLLVRMERMNSRFEVANNGMTLEELKERFAALEQWIALLPQANAADYMRGVVQRNKSSGVLMWDGGQFVCGEGYEVELAIPGCLKLNTDGSTMFSVSEREQNDSFNPCPDGKEIAHPDPSGAGRSVKGCMSVAGYNKLPEARREAIESLERNPGRDIWYDPLQYMRATPEWQKQIAFGTTEDSNSQSNPAVAGNSSAAAPGSSPAAAAGPSASASASAEAAPAPLASSPQSAAAALGGAAAPLASSPESAAAAAAAPFPAPLPNAQAPAAAPAPEQAAAPETPPEDPKADACLPEPKSCDEPTDAAGKKAKAEAIARFRKTAKFGDVDANMCIVGGFMSKYETKSKAAGTCSQVKSFGPAKCNPGWVMCNPALFCHTTTGKDKEGNDKDSVKWFCVNKKEVKDGQWTAACAAKYTDRITNKGAIPEAKDQVGKVCDPTKVKIPAAVQEEWNNMVAALKQMVDVWCGGGAQDFQVLFCRECEIIKAQVYKSMQYATGSGCGPKDAAAPEATESAPAAAPADEAKGKK